MNQKLPRPAAVFLVGTILAAAAALGWSVWHSGFPQSHVWTFLVVCVLAALAHLFPIRSAQTNVATFFVTNTFVFAGVILLSPTWLSLMQVAVWVSPTIQRYRQRKPNWLLVPVANAGQALLVSLGAHQVLYDWLEFQLSPTLLDVGGLALVIIAFVFVQNLWVSIVIHLHLPSRPSIWSLDLWKPDTVLSEAVLLCLGAIIALLWQLNPALLFLVMAPIGFAYYMIRGVQLIRLGELDGKTGLFNNRKFDELVERELTSSKLLRRTFSMIFLDLDFLRDINNTYGHLAGDAVIIEVAHRIKQNLRTQDSAARFGGEEFVLLLPGTEILEAHWIAERIRTEIAEKPFDIGDGKQVRCSVSGGVASFPAHGSSLPQLTASADAALYYAKRQGRNRTYRVDDVPEEERAEPKPADSPSPSRAVLPPAHEPASAPARSPAPEADPVPEAAPARVAVAQAQSPTAWRGESLVLALGLLSLLVPFWLKDQILDWRLLTALALIGFAVEYWKVDLLNQPGRSTFSLGVAVTMAAATTMGPLAAVLVNAVNFVAFMLQARPQKAATLASNLAIMTLAAVLGSLPLALAGNRLVGLNPWSMGMVLAGGALYFLVNVGLITLIVSGKRQVPASQLWREQYGRIAPTFIFTAVCGGLMGSAYLSMGWQAVAVFILPVLIMRHAYQVHIRQSREAFETAERGRLALQKAHDLQSRSMQHLLEAVSQIIDARDASVYGHSSHVARYAVAIAEEMDLSAADVTLIRQAALLHDLGKVGIPEGILHKPDRLTDEEWRIMREHTQIGERILLAIPGLEATARVVGEHHEKYNGKGYPRGLTGTEITLAARILALADALDSIISDRPYSEARPLAWAVDEIRRCAGEHFDPAVVRAFLALVAHQPPHFFVNSAGLVQRPLHVAAAAKLASGD